MIRDYSIHLTCCCGAELRCTGLYSSFVAAEREAFNVRHGDCQPRPVVPLNRAMARAVRLAGRR